MAQSSSLIDGDLTVRGTLKPTALNAPASCIGDSNIDGSNPIGCDKQEHRHQRAYSQVKGSAAVAERRVIHSGYGATGSVVAVRAGVVVANVGAATITVDILKNGVSILTGTITITNSTAAYGFVNGSVATADYVTGDVFEVNVTVAAGGGTLGQGLWVDFITNEDPS